MIKYYRKKPVIVRAMPFYKDTWNELLNFTKGCACILNTDMNPATCIIPTLEGPHMVIEGDYVIEGTKGEFYPCKSDIFKQIYEEL